MGLVEGLFSRKEIGFDFSVVNILELCGVGVKFLEDGL